VKRFGVLFLPLATAGLVMLSAQPAFSPKAAEGISNASWRRRLSTGKARFTHGGLRPRSEDQPVRAADRLLLTTDPVADERGYHGPIHFLVGMDTRGIIRGVVMDYNSEPYGYFSVDPPAFVEQFKNKSIRDPFVVGRDIGAVSRASITMNHAARALREASRGIARAFLTPDQIKQ
jgi:hypothetical protein